MKCPAPLQVGDRIRIVAASGSFDRERFETGLEIIRSAGFEPVFDPGIFARERYLAGSDERRLAELNAALLDPEASAVWTARGGYGATRLLPRLELNSIRDAGKWLIGFSDTTALHAAWARAGLLSLHGANVTTLCDWSDEAREELFACLQGASAPSLSGRALCGDSSVEGVLLGGNLTVLSAMAGTGTLPSMQGAVLLLEDIGERPYRIDRSLTQLEQAGLFDGVRGFAIGQLTGCAEPAGSDVEIDALDVLFEKLEPLAVPIVGEIGIGHEASSHAALLGSVVRLDPVAGRLAALDSIRTDDSMKGR